LIRACCPPWKPIYRRELDLLWTLTHLLIIQAKEKQKKHKQRRIEGRRTNFLGYFSLSFTRVKERLRLYSCKVEVVEIAERRSKKGLLGHLHVLEEEGTQKVKGSLGSPKIAHMCGCSYCCRSQNFKPAVEAEIL